MGKYYVIEEDMTDYFYGYTCEQFYSEEDAKVDHVYLSGDGGWFWNKDLLDDLVHNIDYANYDISTIVDNDEDEDEEDTANEISDTIKYYFEVDDRKFTNKEINELYLLLERRDDGISSRDLINFYCEVLEVIYGEPFTNGEMHGYSTSDWAKAIMPKRVADKKWDFIEAVIFGTGRLFQVSISEADSEEQAIKVADMCEYYTPLYKIDDIKEDIAKEFKLPIDKIEIIEKN